MFGAVETEPIPARREGFVNGEQSEGWFSPLQGTGELDGAGIGGEFGAVRGGRCQAREFDPQNERSADGGFGRGRGSNGLEFEGDGLSLRRLGAIRHRDNQDGQESGRAKSEGGHRASNPIENPLTEAGLDVSELIFTIQNRRDRSERIGEAFKLFELFLTVSTNEQMFFNGGGGRFGRLPQHVFFELIFGQVLY